MPAKKYRSAKKSYENPLGQRYAVRYSGFFGTTTVGFDNKRKAENYAKKKKGKVITKR